MRQKPEGWPRLLNEYITKAQRQYLDIGLVWGTFDCCTYVCDWIQICRGADPMEAYRGKYASRDEALQLLRDNGDGTLREAFANELGASINPRLGQRGDVGYLETENAMGIYLTQGTSTVVSFLGPNGIAYLPVQQVTGAFEV